MGGKSAVLARLPDFREDNTLSPANVRLIPRDIPGVSQAFIIWPDDSDQWPFGHTEDENDVFVEMSRAAFDAVPTARIQTHDIPNADDLEDHPDVCEMLNVHFCISAPRQSVYFHMGTLSGLIKIGFAERPRERLCNQQCGSGERIVSLGSLPGSPELEQLYHARFAPARAHGEWFHPHPDILSFALGGLW